VTFDKLLKEKKTLLFKKENFESIFFHVIVFQMFLFFHYLRFIAVSAKEALGITAKRLRSIFVGGMRERERLN
jgi:hypothetical protein